MSAIVPLYYFIGIIPPKNFSREEIFILEAELLLLVCTEVKEVIRTQYKSYFNLMKFTAEMENDMLNANYIRYAINDILLTEEYTLSGIASYTYTPEEVVYDIISGSNTRPSAIFLQRIIELHRDVKRNLFDEIKMKIAKQFLSDNVENEIKKSDEKSISKNLFEPKEK